MDLVTNQRYLSHRTRVTDTPLTSPHLYSLADPPSHRIRYLEDQPVEYKDDPSPPISQTSNFLFERMRTLSQEQTEDDEEDEESLQEDAKRNIEGKFLFHSRFHHVLNTLHRETTLPQSPQRPSSSDGKRGGLQSGVSSKPSLKTQDSPLSQSVFLNKISNNRKSFSVFESSDPLPATTPLSHVPTKEEEENSTASESLCFSSSTFTEDTNQKRTLSSPRAAMIREGHVRHQIPYVVKELVGNVEVEQTSVISLAGQGIGDEKMLCLVQSLPYFINVDEINISSTSCSSSPFSLLFPLR